MTVATTSKQSIGLFWKSLANGKATRGRYSTSPKMAAQWAKADKTLWSEGWKCWRTDNHGLKKPADKKERGYLCRPLCNLWLLMGYLSGRVRYAECRPLSVRLLYAAWFSGRRNKDRHTNILQHGYTHSNHGTLGTALSKWPCFLWD